MSALAFELPAVLEAHEPPEARGLERDDVRLLVATRHDRRLVHTTFRHLPFFLHAGDLLVINTSATLAAALPARREDGSTLRLHLSTPAPRADEPSSWIVEPRSADGASPLRDVRPGERLALAGGAEAELVAPEPPSQRRLWLARLEVDSPLETYLPRHGRPVRYAYVRDEWPLEDYQTAYALEPGSAEMPSAGRPFTPQLVTRLVAAGVLFAPVVLHTGVSSLESHEPPYAERYRVPATTGRLVNAVRAWRGRVIAVGTTAVRALETVARDDGTVSAGEGWTSLVVTPERGLRVVDGLLTGWHEPEASHLQLLRALAGERLLERSYAAALAAGYLWHEFGDSHLILP
jgi:S-adenosylmethionine:tRNA ribosyltransferase-isomerase